MITPMGLGVTDREQQRSLENVVRLIGEIAFDQQSTPELNPLSFY